MKKKICFFSGDITRGGGTERVATMIANELDRQGEYEVMVLSLVEQAKELFYPLNAQIKHYALGDKWIQPGLGYLPLIKKVRYFVQEQEIDVLIDIDIVLDVLSLPATKKTKTKVISWEHFNCQYENSVLYRRWILNYSVKRSDYIVTLTERDKETYQKELRRIDRIEVIYNPINELKRIKKGNREKWLITTGRLVEGKGMQFLVKMAAHLLPEHPDWKWILLGDGVEREFLEQKISEYGLEKQLILKGMVQNVEEYLEKASVYVLTSEHEGLPMVLLEAKTHAVPCVSFDIYTGPAEIIVDGQDGFLIPPFDCEEMEKKIELLMEEEELRQRFSRATQHSLEKFRIHTIIQKWNEVFGKL